MTSLYEEPAYFHRYLHQQTSSSGSRGNRIGTFELWRLTVERRWQNYCSNVDRHETEKSNDKKDDLDDVMI